MTMTEYVLKILPAPQVAAASVQSAKAFLTTVGGSAIVLYFQFDEPLTDAVKYAFAVGVFPLISRNYEGVKDFMRARRGDVRPWDVAAFEEPLQK